MRRIVEGLGLGLARRASRKLVPVVLTLGSGPSGFPRKLSGRRPKLPRQPRRGRVARARFRNFGAGSWPVGLPETTFRATAEASATAVANPRRRTRALRYFGAGGWPVGLPETIFRATAKVLRQPPSRSLPSFWRWGAAGRASRNKFPSDAKRGDLGRRQPWQTRADARALRYFGARVWRVGLPETIFRAKLPRQPWQTRAVACAHSVILALGGWPDGLPETSFRAMQSGDLGSRRGIRGPKPMSQHGRPRLLRARTRPAAAMAVLSTRNGLMARSLASGCGWPRPYCPVYGVYQRPGRAIFRKGWQSEWQFYQSPPAAVAVLSKPFYQVLSTMAALSRSRTRPVAALAVLSIRSGQMARSGCGWPISYCHV